MELQADRRRSPSGSSYRGPLHHNDTDFLTSPIPPGKTDDEDIAEGHISGSQALSSAFGGNFSLPFFRLRGPSSFALPSLWAPLIHPRVNEDGCNDGEDVCYEKKDREGTMMMTTSSSSSPCWGSLLVPKSQGDEAGIGTSILLDEDGRYLPYHCERLLLLSSLCLVINPLSAFYFKCDFMGYMTLFLFVTSILHWSRPRLGWRRALDIFTARIVVLTFCFVAVATAPPFACAIYLWGFLLVLGLHALGWHFARTQRHLEGTICHMGLHFVGTTVNVFLFSTIGEGTLEAWTDFYIQQ